MQTDSGVLQQLQARLWTSASGPGFYLQIRLTKFHMSTWKASKEKDKLLLFAKLIWMDIWNNLNNDKNKTHTRKKTIM